MADMSEERTLVFQILGLAVAQW